MPHMFNYLLNSGSLCFWFVIAREIMQSMMLLIDLQYSLLQDFVGDQLGSGVN